ncbi:MULTISPECIES: anti-sigma factor [unclassified Beijerinckia]|uniref:anti-sigma factor n=1 Tax=unclassified Beijerinckia TaxID=2638183 RepID=UPI0008948AC2|nr:MULTISPECIES: anti-sigma factor [unclassified Beijerinckia]MDH7799786.1 anti-sigma-K factor RskA [Beijerinckia sp. GAS462]SED37403.1 Anti-sigma-K factor RskA [Beijerinckia sp. 28-YEA-48]
MSDPVETPEEARDALAAEYVLGLVDAVDLPRLETLMETDVDLARRVGAWRQRLGALDETAVPGRANEALWSRIDVALNPRTATAVARRPVVAPSRWAALWDSLAFWRMTGLAAVAAALVLAVGMGYFAHQAGQQPVLVAVLMTDQNEAAAVVRAFANGRAELQAIKPIAIPPGRAIEIWTLWDRTVGPKSIGLIQNVSGKIDLRLDGLPRPTAGQLFEMTLEPATGSPIGRPTGPILNKGNAAVAL